MNETPTPTTANAHPERAADPDQDPLRQRLALLNFALDHVREAAFLMDEAGRFQYVNQEACRSLGYSRAELLAMAITDIDPDYPRKVLPEHMNELRAKGSLTFESRHRTKDGRFFPVEITTSYFVHVGTSLVLALVWDITECELRLNSILEAMVEGVVFQSASGRITFANRAAEKILGLSADELLGCASVVPWKTVCEDGSTIAPEDHPSMVTLRTGQPQSEVVMGIGFGKPEGAPSWISINSQPLVTPGESKPYAVVTTFHDITKRKWAEAALQKNRHILEEAQRIARIGSWELDLSNNRLVWSDEIYRIFEIDPQRFGATYEAFLTAIHPDDREMVNRAYTESVANHTSYDIEHRLLLPDGRIKYVHERCETVYDANGFQTHSLGTVQDISERKWAEEALLNRQRELSKMAVELSLAGERERRRIAAELHDQIGQTLLLGKIKLISLGKAIASVEHGNSFDEIRLLFDQAIREVRSLTLQLSPPMLEGAGLKAALVWLGQKMAEDYDLQVEIAGEQGSKALDEETTANIFMVCRELLINVAKHAQTKTARVTLADEEETLRVTVEDQGVGFDPEGTAVNGPAAKGFGLFSIGERIRFLGGEMTIKVAPDHGTRVSIQVPRQAGGSKMSAHRRDLTYLYLPSTDTRELR